MEENDLIPSGKDTLPFLEKPLSELCRFSYQKGEDLGEFLSDLIDKLFK